MNVCRYCKTVHSPDLICESMFMAHAPQSRRMNQSADLEKCKSELAQAVELLRYWLPDEQIISILPKTDLHCKAHWDKWNASVKFLAQQEAQHGSEG